MTGQEGVKTHVQKGASGYCARHSSSSSTAVHQHRPLETGSSSYRISCMGRWRIVRQVGIMPLHPRVPQIATTSIHTAHVYRSIASCDCTCSASQPLYNKAKKHRSPNFKATTQPHIQTTRGGLCTRTNRQTNLSSAVQECVVRHCCHRIGVCTYPTAHRWLGMKTLQSRWLVDKNVAHNNEAHARHSRPLSTHRTTLTNRRHSCKAGTAADTLPASSAHAGSQT
jgi:hypothetical protein